MLDSRKQNKLVYYAEAQKHLSNKPAIRDGERNKPLTERSRSAAIFKEIGFAELKVAHFVSRGCKQRSVQTGSQATFLMLFALSYGMTGSPIFLTLTSRFLSGVEGRGGNQGILASLRELKVRSFGRWFNK